MNVCGALILFDQNPYTCKKTGKVCIIAREWRKKLDEVFLHNYEIVPGHYPCEHYPLQTDVDRR